MKLKSLPGTVLLLTVILFCSCHPSQKVFKNGDKWIPADFEPRKTILLVQKFTVSKKAQQQMEDYMSETYPFKYEFVSKETIHNKEGKYADTKTYKYALVITSHITTSGTGSAGSGPTVTGFDYNFLDRSIDKNYPPTKKSSSYAIMTFKPVINTIVAKFE